MPFLKRGSISASVRSISSFRSASRELGLVHAREGAQVLHDLLDALGALAAAQQQLARSPRARFVGVAALPAPRAASRRSSSSSCRLACTKPIGLLSSCATPATSWPSERIFSLCISCAWVSRSSRVRSSTRASSVSFSFAISSKALAFSIAIDALVGERAQQLAVVGAEALARELAPDRDHAEQVDAEQDRHQQRRRRACRRASSQASRVSRVGVVVEVAARQLLAPHPEVLADRVLGGELEVAAPSAAKSPRQAAGTQRALVVVEQQHHRALDAHRVRAARARCARRSPGSRASTPSPRRSRARSGGSGRGRGRRGGRPAPAGGRAAG